MYAGFSFFKWTENLLIRNPNVLSCSLPKKKCCINYIYVIICLFYSLKTEDIEKKLKDAEQREEALIKRITEKDKTVAKMK